MKFILSVVTPTFNSSKNISIAINALKSQTDKDFEWVVADGCSLDDTIDKINRSGIDNINIIQQEDFGVFDALNRAIKNSNGKYYLFIGCDDEIYPDTIKNFKLSILKNEADIITSKLHFRNKVIEPGRGSVLLNGHGAYISGHVVSTIFKKDLHNKYGFYSTFFPIAADHDFILKIVSKGVSIKKVDFIAGRFTDGGQSTLDKLGSYTECWRIIMKYHNPILVSAIQILKIIFSWRAILQFNKRYK